MKLKADNSRMSQCNNASVTNANFCHLCIAAFFSCAGASDFDILLLGKVK